MSPKREPELKSRGAVVKLRLAYIRSRGTASTRVHLHYIQRGGVGRDGEPGRLYSADQYQASDREFVERCSDDRHGFRIVLSPRDSWNYEDLEPLVCRFMERMEEDLETRLDWVAVDHFNTSHPHTHLVLRGRDDRGENLVIAPDYIKYGMRLRLGELVSIDLGPAYDFENKRMRRLEIYQDRPTSIDRRLLQDMDAERIVSATSDSLFEQAVRTGRLRKLAALGLATAIGGGNWRLSEELEPRLLELGERSARLRTLHQELSTAGIDRGPSEQAVFQPGGGDSIAGRVVADRAAHPTGGDRYLVIDAVDGRSQYVALGMDDVPGPLPGGAIVRVTSLEGDVHEAKTRVEIVSPIPLEELAGYEGPTWLDRELVAPQDVPRDAGFGRPVRAAMTARRAWLLREGLASLEGERISYRSDMLEVLGRREMSRIRAAISKETGLKIVSAGEGAPISGIVRKRFDLGSGQFAMIDSGHEFSLVPWQPELQSALGRRIGGIVRDGIIAWNVERDLGPEI